MRLIAICIVLVSGCTQAPPPALGGNPENGKLLLRQFACGSCHDIPGVVAAPGKVGPPRGGVGRRVYLAGVLPNTPERMAQFIRAPQNADPRSAMPDLGVTEEHARDMVAYLYSLK